MVDTSDTSAFVVDQEQLVWKSLSLRFVSFGGRINGNRWPSGKFQDDPDHLGSSTVYEQAYGFIILDSLHLNYIQT